MYKSINVEAEHNELILENSHGDKVIIPANKRKWVQRKLDEGCHTCIDSLVETLPVGENYAKDGTVVSKLYEQKTGRPWSTAKSEGLTSGSFQDNSRLQERLIKGEFDNPFTPSSKKGRARETLEYGIPERVNVEGIPMSTSSPQYKRAYDKGLGSYDKEGVLTTNKSQLEPLVVTAKGRHNHSGCVSGLCFKMAETLGTPQDNFRRKNNLYGDAWTLTKNAYGQDIDVSDYKNLKVGDIVNLSRDSFPSDKERGIPDKNQHVGYVSKIEDGKPYITHYIPGVGQKTNGGKYGEYFEEPADNISQRFKYSITGAKRIDHFKEIDSSPSTFKFSEGYTPNKIETEFAKMHDEKQNIQNTLKLTNDEYEELSKIAYGIMGNESSFGRSKRTLYRMAVPDFAQAVIKKAYEAKQGRDDYNPHLNSLSKGYSSSKKSSLHGISDNTGNYTSKEIVEKVKKGKFKDLDKTNNYLYNAFRELKLDPDELEDGTSSGKAIMATLAWYKKRFPNATTDDLLKLYTGKKDITAYKKSFESYLGNIDDRSDNNKTYTKKEEFYGKMSSLANDVYQKGKKKRSDVVSVVRDVSPLPVQYNALIADVLKAKGTITEKSLSKSNLKALKQIVSRVVSEGRYTLGYDDYRTSGDKFADVGGVGESPLRTAAKSFTNDDYILKTLLGQATIKKIDDKNFEILDTFDFNDHGQSFGVVDDLSKRGPGPYQVARSVARNYGSSDGNGQKVRIKISFK